MSIRVLTEAAQTPKLERHRNLLCNAGESEGESGGKRLDRDSACIHLRDWMRQRNNMQAVSMCMDSSVNYSL